MRTTRSFQPRPYAPNTAGIRSWWSGSSTKFPTWIATTEADTPPVRFGMFGLVVLVCESCLKRADMVKGSALYTRA